jgi:hypothetical protein
LGDLYEFAFTYLENAKLLVSPLIGQRFYANQNLKLLDQRIETLCENERYKIQLYFEVDQNKESRWLLCFDKKEQRLDYTNSYWLNWLIESLELNSALGPLTPMNFQSTNLFYRIENHTLLKICPQDGKLNREWSHLKRLNQSKSRCLELNFHSKPFLLGVSFPYISHSKSAWDQLQSIKSAKSRMTLFSAITKKLAHAHNQLAFDQPKDPIPTGQDILSYLPEFAQYAPLYIPNEFFSVHGDFHLGQILITEVDMEIIDWEGPPHPPLPWPFSLSMPVADLAGLMRSIDYLEHLFPSGLNLIDCWSSLLNEYLIDRNQDFSTSIAIDLSLCLWARNQYEIAYESRCRPEMQSIPRTGLKKSLNFINYLSIYPKV